MTLVIAGLAALGLTLSVAAPAQARSQSELRDVVNSRLMVILDDAVDSGIYSSDQTAYIAAAVRTSTSDLNGRQATRVVGAFWTIVAAETGLTEERAASRLRNGATLARLADDADDLRERLYRWLASPVARAILNGEISFADSSDLRSEIRVAVNRLVAQPGGGRDVVLVRKRH